ncbi:MAG: hypothetical protein ACXACG_09565 [Candidatus Thorarchaeota archaeon]
MSTPTITPGAKAENAVYLAFGLTLGLYLYKVFDPDIFNDIRGLVAAAALSASLIGAVFFYVKMDRIMPWALQRITLRNEGQQMSQFLIYAKLYYNICHISMVENWPTIHEECEHSVSDAVESSELYDEMWRLRGGFYFVLGVIFLLFSIGIDNNLSFILLVVIESCVILSMIERSWKLPKLVTQIALTRKLKDFGSMTLSRLDLGQEYKTYVNDTMKPTIPGHKGMVDTVLNELEEMAKSTNWARFSQRFAYLRKDFENSIRAKTEKYDRLSDYLVETAVYRIDRFNESSSILKKTQIADYLLSQADEIRNLLSELRPYNPIIFDHSDFNAIIKAIDVMSRNPWKKHLQTLIARGFTKLNKKELENFNEASVLAIYTWRKVDIEFVAEGIMRYIIFVPNANDVLKTIRIDDNPDVWEYVTDRHLLTLMEIGIEGPHDFFEQIILHSDLSFMLVKTYPSIYSFIVENWEYSWNGWVAAMNSIPDNYIGTSGAVIALKNRKIRQRFVELAHILYDDTRTSKGLVRYLRTMIRINPEEMAWIEQSLSSELKEEMLPTDE